jgi:hypothetical protein
METNIPSPIRNDLYRLVILHDSFGRILHQHTVRLPAPEAEDYHHNNPNQ